MEKGKGFFSSSTISDADLELILRERLKEDPSFYIDFLKKIIDGALGEIDDKTLFELLEPAFIYKDAEAGDFEVVPSPEGVDMLFYPEVRAKLKEWQRIYLDRKAKDFKRERAKDKIRKIFETITDTKKGRPRSLSPEKKEGIRNDYFQIMRKWKEISRKARYSNGYRNRLVRESFPDVGEKIVYELNKHILPISREKLRNLVLTKRYNCSERAIEEFIRKEGTVKFFKYLKEHPEANMIEQTGDEKIKIIKKKTNHT